MGNTIEEYRKKKGLTQAEFAKVMKVTQGAVCQWESGATSPKLIKLMEMADLFGCTVDELLHGKRDGGQE